MTEPVYIQNVSDLEFGKCLVHVSKNTKGGANLFPGEIGILLPELVGSVKVKLWLEKKRVVVVKKEDYEAYLRSKAVKAIPATPPPKPKPTKTGPQSIGGTTVIVPGLDEIPEADELPEPLVTNIGRDHKGLAITAPPDAEPMTQNPGDPITMSKKDLRPKILHNDGSTSEIAIEPAPVVPAHVDVATIESISPVAVDAVKVITVTAPVTPPAVPVVASAPITAESVLKLSNWRQQKKQLDACTDPAVIAAVAEKTTTDAIKTVCQERLAALKK